MAEYFVCRSELSIGTVKSEYQKMSTNTKKKACFPLMLTIEDVYCHPFPVNEQFAKSVQSDISYLYRNFNSTLPSVFNVVESIKVLFLKALGKHFTQDMSSILGLTSTSSAFHIPFADELPQTPDDTRISMIIGKPVAVMNTIGKWEIGKEKRYVVSLRVLNRSTLHFTKVIPAFIRSVHLSAIGKPPNPVIAKDGEETRAPEECCERVVGSGKRVVETIVTFTKEQIDKMVQDALIKFESLVNGLTSSIVEESRYDYVEIKRIHSRCNTEFIEKEVVGMKAALGTDDSLHPPRVWRNKVA